MKQIPNTASGDRAQDRAARCTTEILNIVTHALAGWLDREPADFTGARAAIEARVRAEIDEARDHTQ